MKKNVLIIGGGGVAQVVAHKCAQNNDVLGQITLASRTQSKCDAIVKTVEEKGSMKVPGKIQTFAYGERSENIPYTGGFYGKRKKQEPQVESEETDEE